MINLITFSTNVKIFKLSQDNMYGCKLLDFVPVVSVAKLERRHA